MIIEVTKRKYRLKKRAARQQETHERIIDAAMALHEELGPAATTISALAERAGVQRLTVYRHFEDEHEIFEACSSKWLSQNPPPDISRIANADPAERTRAVLLALYTYYHRTRGMWSSLYRDRGEVEALEEPMARFDDYLSDIERALLKEWAPCKSRQLRATLAHSLSFSTWRSLADLGLGREVMADLVTSWIRQVHCSTC